MSSDIVFQQGDLLQYTRSTKGEPDLPDDGITVRGVVVGFEVQRSQETGETSVSVWLVEGSTEVGEPERQELSGDDVTVAEVKTYKERELVAWDLDDLLSFDPEVVSLGNSPRDLANFEVGR